MKAHIVLAHPEPLSFNGRLAKTSAKSLADGGWSVTTSDLYQMDFDAREGAHNFKNRADAKVFHPQTEQRFSADSGSLPEVVQHEIERLKASDLLVVHFPLWWFGPPAIFKGWMDRVFVYGALYRSSQRYDTGICSGKKVIACVTTGASAQNCAPNGREGDTRMHLWPVLYPFRYLGFSVYEPEILHGVGAVAYMEGHEEGLSTVEAHAGQWAKTLTSLEDRAIIKYNADTDFDYNKQLLPSATSYSPFIRNPRR